MKMSRYVHSPKAAAEGVWKDLEDGGRVKVAMLGNSAFEAARDEAFKDYPDLNEVPTGVFRERMAYVYANTVLLDWEGFEQDDGTPILYTIDQAAEYMGNDQYMEFQMHIFKLAKDYNNYRATQRAIVGKS
jgi:hypothetical protein